MNQEIKDWIDKANYEALLRKWRSAPAGDPFFQGEEGEYYSTKMAEKRTEVGNDAHVSASKRIGW